MDMLENLTYPVFICPKCGNDYATSDQMNQILKGVRNEGQDLL